MVQNTDHLGSVCGVRKVGDGVHTGATKVVFDGVNKIKEMIIAAKLGVQAGLVKLGAFLGGSRRARTILVVVRGGEIG